MKDSVRYAVWDGDPAVIDDTAAFVFRSGAWEPANLAVVGMEAPVLPRTAFEARFPSMPKSPLHDG